MRTTQAQRLIDALRAIGLTHGSWRTGRDFTVATDVKQVRSRESGRYYSEYGHAMASLQNREARELVAERAQELADQELNVILVYANDQLVDSIVSSRWNSGKTVSILRDGEWS